MRTVDLFCGCGGMSLGFQNAGFEIHSAYDHWDIALETYAANFKHDLYNFDLSDVDNASKHIKRYEPEVVIGGPHCQDFSIAGKRKEMLR